MLRSIEFNLGRFAIICSGFLHSNLKIHLHQHDTQCTIYIKFLGAVMGMSGLPATCHQPLNASLPLISLIVTSFILSFISLISFISFTLAHSFSHSFTNSFIPDVHSLISFIRSLAQSFIHFVYFVRSAHSFSQSFTHSQALSLSHFIHSRRSFVH